MNFIELGHAAKLLMGLAGCYAVLTLAIIFVFKVLEAAEALKKL